MNTTACMVCYKVGTAREIRDHACPGIAGRLHTGSHYINHRKPSKGQTKRHSAAEAFINTSIGFAISYIANLIVLPWFGLKVTPGAAFGIGVIFTVISIVRSYVLRRIFNHIMIKKGEVYICKK